MVFTETIQARGISGVAESPGSLLMLSVGETHLQSISCFWPDLLFLFRAASSSEQRRHSALGKNECEWATQASQPTYNKVPSSLQSLWSWYSHATRHLELTRVSVKWQRTSLGVFEKKEWAMQAKTQEPGFKEWTHWENSLTCRQASYPLAGLLPQFSERGTWWVQCSSRQHFSAKPAHLKPCNSSDLPVFDSEFKHTHYLSLKYSLISVMISYVSWDNYSNLISVGNNVTGLSSETPERYQYPIPIMQFLCCCKASLICNYIISLISTLKMSSHTKDKNTKKDQAHRNRRQNSTSA